MGRADAAAADVAALGIEFADASQRLFSSAGLPATLALVGDVVVEVIESCDFAGIFAADGAMPVPSSKLNLEAERANTRQHTIGHGPSLDAVLTRRAVYAEDLDTDVRWPGFRPRVTGMNLRSVLAVPMLSNGPLGALTLYAFYPQAFGVLDRARAVLLGALATAALRSARDRESNERQAVEFLTALGTRELIGQAQGILMERERITAEQAFDVLRRASQHLNIKLREVAARMVQTGERPETGDS